MVEAQEGLPSLCVYEFIIINGVHKKNAIIGEGSNSRKGSTLYLNSRLVKAVFGEGLLLKGSEGSLQKKVATIAKYRGKAFPPLLLLVEVTSGLFLSLFPS